MVRSLCPQHMERIRITYDMRDVLKAKYLISVDSEKTFSLSGEILDAGADILVAGSVVFNAKNRKEAIADLIRRRR